MSCKLLNVILQVQFDNHPLILLLLINLDTFNAEG